MSGERAPTSNINTNEAEKPWKFIFPASPTKYPFAFRRGENVYLTIHFNGERFGHPETKETISIRDFLEQMMKEFGTKSLIISACYPDKARQIIGNLPGVTVLGSGNCEVQTKYNDARGIITVRSMPDHT